MPQTHLSLLTQACSTMEEAEATVAHYAAKDQPARIEKDDASGKFLVYRIEDNKVRQSASALQGRGVSRKGCLLL